MKKAFIDSPVLLDPFLAPARAKTALSYLSKMKSGQLTGVSSSLVLMEMKYHLRKRVGRRQAEEACALYLDFPHFRIIPVDAPMASKAADLRNKYYHLMGQPFSSVDAVNLACAIAEKCDTFLTADSDFLTVDELSVEKY